jgi:hypothetical protein
MNMSSSLLSSYHPFGNSRGGSWPYPPPLGTFAGTACFVSIRRLIELQSRQAEGCFLFRENGYRPLVRVLEGPRYRRDFNVPSLLATPGRNSGCSHCALPSSRHLNRHVGPVVGHAVIVKVMEIAQGAEVRTLGLVHPRNTR